MKLFATAVLLLGSVGLAQAQETAPAEVNHQGNVSQDFAATSAAHVTIIDSLPPTGSYSLLPAAISVNTLEARLAPPALAVPLGSADPAAPSPAPKFVFGGRDDYRWQLSLGVTWLRFRSAVLNASAVGIKTSVSYFTNDWFAIEGNVTAAFAPTILRNEHVKTAVYGGGPKIAWRQRRWEPWVHGIFGGAHLQPQVAGGVSRNTYSIQAGGGADYRWNPRVSFRLEGDLVRTGFFKQSQNDFQLTGGVVLHF